MHLIFLFLLKYVCSFAFIRNPNFLNRKLVLRKATLEKNSNIIRRQKRKKVPLISIIGRPNVGKSALVNRIAGTQSGGAIVADESGITRDRTYRKADFLGEYFTIVDTGGLVFDDNESLFASEIRSQAMVAIEESSAVIFVVDGQKGMTSLDLDIADFVRKEIIIPVIIAVNKCESMEVGDTYAVDFWSLGLGKPHAVSAIHGTGVAEMLEDVYDKIVKKQTAIPGFGSKAKLLEQAQNDVVKAVKGEYILDDDEETTVFLRQYGLNTDDKIIQRYEDAMAAFEEEKETEEINVAIIGRPNVGKSMLLNSLFGSTRAIVSDIAGTTRDSIDAVMERPPPPGSNATTTIYKFVDTAGIRRKGKVKFGPEFFMVNRALRAIRRSDVVLLVTDATTGVSEQDRTLAQIISNDGRACIILCNKWDAVVKDSHTLDQSVKYMRDELSQLKWAPILFISAITGQRVNKIYHLVDTVVAAHRKRAKTSVLNEVLRDAILWQPPPVKRSGTQAKIYYCNQVSTRPPTIVVFCNDPKLISDNYKRFLDRKFRESFSGYEGTPIRWIFRGKRLRDVMKSSRVSNGPPGFDSGTNYPFPHAS